MVSWPRARSASGSTVRLSGVLEFFQLPLFLAQTKKNAREASLPMVGRRSGCAFRWESGKLRYAMKHHFLAWMEVAIISFLGLRSPLPRIFALPVQIPLGRSPLLYFKRLNKKSACRLHHCKQEIVCVRFRIWFYSSAWSGSA